MRRHDHFFDWDGFSFVLRVGAILLLAIVLGRHQLGQFFDTAPALVAETPYAAPAEGFLAGYIPSALSERSIASVTIPDVVPSQGKFIAADLTTMQLSLYEDGELIGQYPITHKGRPGTAWETPAGLYSIHTKEELHFSTIGHVFMPHSMQFYGNYFLHGPTFYPDGTPTAPSFSGGCMRLSAEDAATVFAFADVGTRLFVYDAKEKKDREPLALSARSLPRINAQAYLVADMDTGHVYMEKNAQKEQPIGGLVKLATALVANETISFDKKIAVPRGGLVTPADLGDTRQETFVVGDVLYPLLMQSSDPVAEALSSYYGEKRFLTWMNRSAQALNMLSTTYADASGASLDNRSTADDLYRLAVYLANKKSFVFKITHADSKTISSDSGSSYEITNLNVPAESEPFLGGKAATIPGRGDGMLSVLSIADAAGEDRRIAVIILGSEDRAEDTSELAGWIAKAAQDSAPSATACAACAVPDYRTIEL